MPSKRKSKKTAEHWLHSINDISTSFNIASRDIDSVLKLLVKRLVKELGAYAVAVWTLEESTNFMRIEASAGLDKGYIRYFNQTDRIRAGKGLVGKVMSGKKTLYTTDPGKEKKLNIQRWRDIVTKEGFSAIVSAPMFVGKEIVGAFNVYYKKQNPTVDSFELQFIEIIANQIAVTIENIKGYETIKTYGDNLLNQVEKLLDLQNVTASLSLEFHKSEEKSLESFSHYITERFGAVGTSILRWNGEKNLLDVIASYGLSKNHRNYLETHPQTSGKGTLAGLAFQERNNKFSTKVFVDERIDKLWRTLFSIEEISATVALPLVVRDQGLGVLVIYYEKPHTFSNEETGILSILAHYIAVSLMNIQIFDSLASERQKMTYMVNSLFDGLIVYDLDQKITAFNPKAEELLWVSSKDVVGKTPDELDTRKNNLLSNIKLFSSLNLSDFEKREVTISNPENKVFDITMVPLVGEEKRKTGSMQIVHDVTAEKESEWLKSSFVAVAGHQLRTPLSGIKWMLDMLLSGDLGEINDSQRDYIKKGFKSTDNLTKVVQDLLDVSKLEQKRFSYEPVQTDVYDVVSSAYQNLSSAIEISEKNLNITLDKPPSPLPKIMTDPEKLKMAFQNIIDNAIQYTQKDGDIRITFRFKNDSIITSIKDNGIGIPKKEQKFLFTRFFRASNAIRLRPDGSGLGLFVAKEIITHFNGKIWVDSEEKQGSTFSVVLPITQISGK